MSKPVAPVIEGRAGATCQSALHAYVPVQYTASWTHPERSTQTTEPAELIRCDVP